MAKSGTAPLACIVGWSSATGVAPGTSPLVDTRAPPVSQLRPPNVSDDGKYHPPLLKRGGTPPAALRPRAGICPKAGVSARRCSNSSLIGSAHDATIKRTLTGKQLGSSD